MPVDLPTTIDRVYRSAYVPRSQTSDAIEARLMAWLNAPATPQAFGTFNTDADPTSVLRYETWVKIWGQISTEHCKKVGV